MLETVKIFQSKLYLSFKMDVAWKNINVKQVLMQLAGICTRGVQVSWSKNPGVHL